MFVMNTARHDSTRFTPAFLNFGRELEISPALHRFIQTTQEREPNPTLQEITEQQVERLQKLKDIFELVRINLATSFTSRNNHYNLCRTEWRCHSGDRMMKKKHHVSHAIWGFNTKLAPKFSVQYIVVLVISPVIYAIKANTTKKQRVHIKDLKV